MTFRDLRFKLGILIFGSESQNLFVFNSELETYMTARCRVRD